MQNFDLFHKKVAKAQSIVITTHEYPDADGIGSQIALCMALRELGKKTICVNELPLLDRYTYLDPESTVIGFDDFDPNCDKFDLMIVVDTNTKSRVGKELEKYCGQFEQVLYIDHHPCRDLNPDEHIVYTQAAATGELVGEIIKSMNIKFTQTMALALYTAIIIDTSSFRYPNVTANTHRIVSELMDAGVSPPQAYNGIYGTKKVKHMHTLGSILMSTQTNEREDVAWIVLDMEEVERRGTDVEDTHGYINNLLVLDDIKVACMFRDDGDRLKISFRSTGAIDVGRVAKLLGGGGHSHSAATIIDKDGKSLDQLIKESVQKIEVALDSI